MEYMKIPCHLHTEAEKINKITSVLTNPFLSKNIEPNWYTTTLSLSAIHIFILPSNAGVKSNGLRTVGCVLGVSLAPKT